MREEISIGRPLVSRREGRARLSAPVRMGRRERELWFEVEEAFSRGLAGDVLDAFVVALLAPAILRGADLHARGPISEKLCYNVSNYLIPLLSDFYRKPRATRLVADGLAAGAAGRAPGLALGFSGGIDSFCSYYDHSGDRVPPAYRVTHLLFYNVGSHGLTGGAHDIFLERYARLRGFARAEGRPLIAVDSNLDPLLGLEFMATATIRNAAAALALQNAFGRYVYSSSYALRETTVKGPPTDIAYLEPLLMPLLGTERLDCIASGGQHSRVEKTLLVAGHPASSAHLDVCVRPQDVPEGAINCSACWKCVRTQLTLKIHGKLGLYGRVFRDEVFRLHENVYLVEALASPAPLAAELRRAIVESGFRVPLPVRLAAALCPGFVARRIGTRLLPHLSRRRRLLSLIDACLSWGPRLALRPAWRS